jgi:hypothetical protein
MPVRKTVMTITLKIKNGTLIEGESLCRTCRNASIQKGFRESEEAIFCNWGMFRAVPFKVADCTDYSNRLVPYRWELEKMALLINVDPKRKPAGFRGEPGFAKDADESEEEDSVSSME